jgi:hypothetical protein
VLAPAAAGSVFEMDVSVHRFGVLSFFLLRKFVVFALVVVRQQLAAWK